MVRRATAGYLVAATAVFGGCGDEGVGSPAAHGATTSTSTTDGAAACAPGELPLDDGGCLAAGVPPERCAPGFESDGERACRAVQPSEPCPPGTMAPPGETACREIAPCGDAPFGDAPLERTTEFVDASYGGGDSDGSYAKPWTTIQAGVDAAADGAAVAIAAGDYAEHVVVQDKAVRLWGRCPSMVHVRAASGSLVVDALRASGLVVHGLHVTGFGGPAATKGGVLVRGSVARIERSWIDGLKYGAEVQDYGGVGELRVHDCLVESSGDAGLLADGGDLIVERSHFRGARGHGAVAAQARAGRRPKATIVHSVVEQSEATAVVALAAELEMIGSLVRDTAGAGIVAAVHAQPNEAGERSRLTLRACVVEGAAGIAIGTKDTDVEIEDTTVRHIVPSASQAALGLIVSDEGDAPDAPLLSVRRSTLADVRGRGVALQGAGATLETVLVRDVADEPTEDSLGFGVVASVGLQSGAPSTLVLSGVRVERATSIGVAVNGSTATIDRTLVSATRPSADGLRGRALHVQDAMPAGVRPVVAVSRSRFEGSSDVGVSVVDADLTFVDSVVSGVAPEPSSGTLGDGIAVVGILAPATAVLERVRVEHVERAGLGVFAASAAQVTVVDTAFECTTFPIDVESFGGAPQLSDGGGNVCACEGVESVCQAQSAGLAAPEPL